MFKNIEDIKIFGVKMTLISLNIVIKCIFHET